MTRPTEIDEVKIAEDLIAKGEVFASPPRPTKESMREAPRMAETAEGVEWERVTRAVWAIHYDWSKRERQAIEDFILTVRHSIADVQRTRNDPCERLPTLTRAHLDALARVTSRMTEQGVWGTEGERLSEIEAFLQSHLDTPPSPTNGISKMTATKTGVDFDDVGEPETPDAEGKVFGYDAGFWYQSYRILVTNIIANLDEFIQEDDVAEEAIYADAIVNAAAEITKLRSGDTPGVRVSMAELENLLARENELAIQYPQLGTAGVVRVLRWLGHRVPRGAP